MSDLLSNLSIPNTWTKCLLGDVLNLRNGFAFKSDRYKEHGIPVIRISDINEGEVTVDNAVRVNESEEYDEFLVESGDILVAMSGATTGKFGIYNSAEKAYQNQRVGNFKPHSLSLLNKKYIYYLLFALKDKILRSAYGGAQPNISSGKIEQFEIPLAPFNEQNRIVQKLDELLSELEKGKEQLQTSLEQLKVYRQSILKSAFEGKLTNENVRDGELPNGWRHERFDNLTINHDGKRVPLSRAEREKRQGKYRYYGATGVIDHIDDFIFDGRYLLIGEDGANLVTKSRELAFIAEGKFWVNNHAHIVQAKDGYLLDYIYHYFNSLNLSEYVTGSAQPKLSQSNLNKIPIPVPPTIEEQKKIALELDKQFSIINETEKSILLNLSQTDILKRTLLKKAFEGKLVDQDPNDEPANLLLERIKKEREEFLKLEREQKKSKPRKEMNKSKSPKTDPKSIENIMKGFGKKSFTFDELRTKVNLPYDDLKEELFALLDKGKGLKTEFDTKDEQVKFKYTGK